LQFKKIITLLLQPAYAVLGEKSGIYPFAGRFKGNGFGAIFTKIEGMGILLFRPGTARAVKTCRLIGIE